MNSNGAAFDSQQRRQIEELISTDSLTTIPWEDIEDSHNYAEAIDKHAEYIMHSFPGIYKLRVVVDCGCGTASLITPYLLRRLGCEVIALNCYPSGFFPHPIEPTEANLKDLLKATIQFGADLGIAHDGDSDRMMVVDDRGKFISGDKLLAIFAQSMGVKEVVTTIDASMAIDEMGFSITRTKVGDNHVSEKLKEEGEFGGEPSGSWIFPNISLCPDGIYAVAQAVAIASQHRLSQLADKILSYPLIRGSISNKGVIISKLEQQLMTMKPQSVTNTDGIKLNFDDGWLLIRPSGTEPKIRVTAEAKSEVLAHQLYDNGVKIIKESVQK